jgi:hypothetical protein
VRLPGVQNSLGPANVDTDDAYGFSQWYIQIRAAVMRLAATDVAAATIIRTGARLRRPACYGINALHLIYNYYIL